MLYGSSMSVEHSTAVGTELIGDFLWGCLWVMPEKLEPFLDAGCVTGQPGLNGLVNGRRNFIGDVYRWSWW